jgi:hypothetical protein
MTTAISRKACPHNLPHLKLAIDTYPHLRQDAHEIFPEKIAYTNHD